MYQDVNGVTLYYNEYGSGEKSISCRLRWVLIRMKKDGPWTWLMRASMFSLYK